MPQYGSKKDIERALKEARKKLKKARDKNPRDEQEIKLAIKNCVDIQYVLDRWDALNSGKG